MPTVGGDAAAWIVVITGVVTGIGAMVLNRRSQRDQNKIEEAANRVAADKQRLEETQQALDAMQTLADRHLAEADRWRERAEKAENERDEQKELHRAMYAAQEARCREYAQELTEAILVLRHVVVDEVARTAADVALSWEKHPHHRPTLPSTGHTKEGTDG